jgi:formate--tetrahydrofolate ligase
MTTDIEIARATPLQPIVQIAAHAAIPEVALESFGRFVAKLRRDFVADACARDPGKLVLVSAISPTPAGEGKTTTTIGLGDALNLIGRRAMICLREPSLGPCFGQKGGATGGGRSQVVPMERINLHFTGDFHAISTAHNLLAALIDNHIYWGNRLDIDSRRVSWRRALDINDRALREVIVGLGGPSNGFSREDGFDITVASEIMAVLCLARDRADLEERLGRMIVARTRQRTPITARDLQAVGAMSALLLDALQPNLVQTLEGSPALIHGGPFANIAHGCNSVIATRTALGLADIVVTEGGFGADLGGEKFIDIKCRQAGLSPAACVVVATLRALKMHGGVARADLERENVDAVALGFANLERHVENMRRFGLPVVIAVNHFTSDTPSEWERLSELCQSRLGTDAIFCRNWAEGGAGALDLARRVAALCDESAEPVRPLYSDALPLTDKIRIIAREIYGAADIAIDGPAQEQLRDFEAAGFGNLPICMAKTQYSFSTDPSLLGAPSGHTVEVREVRLAAGAGFVVAICGNIMTMPGLPRTPAAERIHVDGQGRIEGLS